MAFSPHYAAILLACAGILGDRVESQADDDHPSRLAAPEAFVGSRAGDERQVAGVKLCWCPAGHFTMGSPRTEPERRPGENQVEVTLSKGFWTGKFEVTQGDWKRIVGTLPGPLTPGGGAGDDLPVFNGKLTEAGGVCTMLSEQ